MPTLDWIGKKAVVNHHREVAYRMLKCDASLSVGEPGSGNLLVQGDNLLALKSLLPYYAAQVKCIYIDPPYNTGKEDWIYNDNVNSPEIRKWIGERVGDEAEDLCRHDKWLCMMYPRLALAMEFLSDDGILFCSIDDNELPALRMLLDGFFGVENLLACFIWQTEGNIDNQAKVKISHEYILMYAKDRNRFSAPPVIDPNIPKTSKLFRAEIRNTIVKNGPRNPKSTITLPIGFPAAFEKGVIKARQDAWPHISADIHIDDYKTLNESSVYSGWSSKRILDSFIDSHFKPVADTKDQETVFVLAESGAIEAVKRRPQNQSHVISVIREVGTTQQASAWLLTHGLKFDYPKPVGLIRYLLSMVRGNDFTVLDFFAGSGTTGHAVMELNAMDGGNRRFVLVDWVEKIAREICQPRLQAATDTTAPNGTESGMLPHHTGVRYCTLGEELFDELGQLCKSVTFSDLARHVFFTETGEPLPKLVSKKSPLIGKARGKAYYLLFNGILGDKKPDGGNVLTGKVLDELPKHDGPKIVFGEGCRLSAARLAREQVTFKQIPYEIKVS